MVPLSALRCNHHGEREAAALCTRCRKPYCRECVTEHEGAVLCNVCLARPQRVTKQGLRFGLALLSCGVFTVSLLSLVLVFALVGKVLLVIPSELHEGSVWQTGERP